MTAVAVETGVSKEALCDCMKKPVKLIYRKGAIFWQNKTGDKVHKGDVVCEAEIEKRVIEFKAPATGYLVVAMKDSEKFKQGDVLGYIVEECEA